MTAEGGASGADAAVRREVKACPECAQRYTADSMFCPFDGTQLVDTVWVAPTDPSLDPLLGAVVDSRYRVERVLGEGGTGTVYEVVHETLRRRFAMKVLRRDLARDGALATRFTQEARATASLKHPHIVSISDFGLLPDKTPYFVMERLSGHTLAQVAKAQRPLPLERSIRIVLQVAEALAAAHEGGVIHRDLKPENLFMVGGGGGDGTEPEAAVTDDVRVVDFGAAKIAGATRITKTGIVFGTPHYMSPEQASGQEVDPRADIYALGVIMYELFTGRLPFEADTLMGVLTKHIYVEPPPFAEAAAVQARGAEQAQVMAALEVITLRAMAKRPEQRIDSMAALADELERAVVFDASGRAVLSKGWAPPPAGKARPAVSELPRSVEGSDRADVYPSAELPVIPRSSLRGSALAGLGVLVFAGVVGALALQRGSPVGQPTVAPASSVAASEPGVASSSAVAPPASVHVTSLPPFAEVWLDGRRLGTAPMDVPIDPTGTPTRCTLRASGYTDRTLVLDSTSTATMQVTLEQAAPGARPGPSHRSSAPSSTPRPARRHPSDGELVDPFSR